MVVGDPSSAGDINFSDFVQGGSRVLQPAPTCKDDAAFWLYSSGSTGVPKACVHLQHDMVVSTERYAKAILKISERDRFFSVAKLFLPMDWEMGFTFLWRLARQASCFPGLRARKAFSREFSGIGPLCSPSLLIT